MTFERHSTRNPAPTPRRMTSDTESDLSALRSNTIPHTIRRKALPLIDVIVQYPLPYRHQRSQIIIHQVPDIRHADCPHKLKHN